MYKRQIPDPGLADAPSASEGARGFRAVARDRLLLALIAGNLALVMIGRYMSLYQLSFMVGVALGPAVGGVLLGTSPNTIWWGGAFALALTGAGFLRLGNRIPDPLLPTKSPPLQAASEAT